MSEERTASQVQTIAGTFYIVPMLSDMQANLVQVLWQQSAKYHCRRVPLAHALHLLAEYSVEPDLPAFP